MCVLRALLDDMQNNWKTVAVVHLKKKKEKGFLRRKQTTLYLMKEDLLTPVRYVESRSADKSWSFDKKNSLFCVCVCVKPHGAFIKAASQ